MSSNPFFSIVVPTYNREGFVVKTIQSLLNTAYDQFEVIVVDDGSTDNTESAVRQIKDARLSYYKKTNAERAAARNFGARLAKGLYVNFFDSDDTAYPNHLDMAAKAVADLRQPEVFHLGYDVKDGDGVLLRTVSEWTKTINDRLINGNHLSCNGVFLRKDVAEKFPFNETRALSASEDYELWLRLASRFPIHCVNGITSTVVNHEARSVLKINMQGMLKRMEVLRSALLADDQFCKVYAKQISTFDAYCNIYIALHLVLANYPKTKGITYLINAARTKPSVVFTRRFLAVIKKLVL
jgi:glycosyltransferase involved in cell wall biosynthesis